MGKWITCGQKWRNGATWEEEEQKLQLVKKYGVAILYHLDSDSEEENEYVRVCNQLENFPEE